MSNVKLNIRMPAYVKQNLKDMVDEEVGSISQGDAITDLLQYFNDKYNKYDVDELLDIKKIKHATECYSIRVPDKTASDLRRLSELSGMTLGQVVEMLHRECN